ncbi:MAG: hypothetical protein KGQ57_01675 [Burkholderiales bacterium]|nr:hypothetical protein [Burkholderiales bacterium]
MRTQGVDPASAIGVMNYLQDSEIRQREMWAEIGEIQDLQQKRVQQGSDAELAAPEPLPNLKVIICTLVAPDSAPEAWVPIYVHAKVMIIDDAFTTLGSANINFRSMNVDSEINIALENGLVATGLRQDLWGLHTRGGGAPRSNLGGLEGTYSLWTDIVNENQKRKNKNMAPKASVIGFFRVSNDRSYKD